jgi:hypothetical protein
MDELGEYFIQEYEKVLPKSTIAKPSTTWPPATTNL